MTDENEEEEAPPSFEKVPAALPAELARDYRTADVPAISGDARLVPEDFVVEEVPLYEASGEGEHLYVKIEKRGLSTLEAISRLARVLHVRDRDVGYAGMKDAHAITRQTLSFQLAKESDLEGFEDAKVKVVSVSRHKNKLKLGHLKGNRFTIRLRGTRSEDEARTAQVLERLARSGAPNYFGLQRFGTRRNTHRLGLELVRGDSAAFLRELLGKPAADDPPRSREAREAFERGDAKAALDLVPGSLQAERTALQVLAREPQGHEKAVRAIPLRWRRLYTSALQSVLFNRYLTRRLERIDRLEAGEIAYLNRNGAAFVVADEAVEQARCEKLELSPSGPLFGAKLLRPKEGSAPRVCEDAVLAELGLASAELGDALGAAPRGERRSLRVLVADPSVKREGEDLVLAFFLPKGCYATSILEELLKRPVASSSGCALSARRKSPGVEEPTERLERLGLDLSDALAGEVDLLAHLAERLRLGPVEAVAHGEDLERALGHLAQDLGETVPRLVAFGQRRGVDLVLVLDVARERVALARRLRVQADRLVDRAESEESARHDRDRALGDLGRLGDLLEARLAAGLLLDLARELLPLGDLGVEVARDPHGLAVVGEGAADRLLDPPGRVGREATVHVGVEEVGRPREADVPLLDQVEEREASPDVAARDRDDEPQVRAYELVARGEVAAPEAAGESLLLVRGEQPVALDGLEVLVEALLAELVHGRPPLRPGERCSRRDNARPADSMPTNNGAKSLSHKVSTPFPCTRAGTVNGQVRRVGSRAASEDAWGARTPPGERRPGVRAPLFGRKSRRRRRRSEWQRARSQGSSTPRDTETPMRLLATLILVLASTGCSALDRANAALYETGLFDVEPPVASAAKACAVTVCAGHRRGRGAVVGPRTVLTVAHVIGDEHDAEVATSGFTWGKAHVVRRIASSPEDVVVLELDAAEDGFETSRSVREGQGTPSVVLAASGAHGFEHASQLRKGDSGSPVLGVDGALVGLLVGTTDKGSAVMARLGRDEETAPVLVAARLSAND